MTPPHFWTVRAASTVFVVGEARMTIDLPQAGGHWVRMSPTGPGSPVASPDPQAQHQNQDVVGQGVDEVAHEAAEDLGPDDPLK